jgi:hypothetical protein
MISSLQNRTRIWRRGSRWSADVSSGEPFVPGLSFRETPGPMLTVVGLAGGAGASVLAYLTAVTAARESSAPVLVVDTGGPTGGLAGYAAVSARLTLADIAERLARREPVGGALWAEGKHGLRVLAGVPQFTVDGHESQVGRVLSDARQAHGLTVVDAGTLSRRSEHAGLAAATHIAWVLVANDDGVARARRVLERIAPISRPQVLVARADPAGRKPPISALADLADERRAPLVLMPTFGAVSEVGDAAMADRAGLALQVLGGVIRR